MTQSAREEGVRHEPSYFSDVRYKLSEEQEVKKTQDNKGQPKREMRTLQSQSQRGAFRSPHSLSSSAMSPLSTASITFAALLILTIPVCQSAPADLQQATTDQRQLLSEIDAVCSSYLSADLRFLPSDVLGELCVLMLVQKSKELNVRENSKRSPQLHPLLRLVSQLNTRKERGFTVHAELQGPGGIQSRGYFLYRPRNGRRSLEYE